MKEFNEIDDLEIEPLSDDALELGSHEPLCGPAVDMPGNH